MIQYLIIQLDDTSTSYCHYESKATKPKLISLDDLRAAIVFGMKENLMIQYLYPNYELPEEYKTIIESIDHSKIVPSTLAEKEGDVIVINGWKRKCLIESGVAYVLRISKKELFASAEDIISAACSANRFNIVLTDIESFDDSDFEKYKDLLQKLSLSIENLYLNGKYPQINILTDRVMLTEMNNCGAGSSNITVAPDGRFYVCPAFYYETAVNKYMGLGGPEEAPFSIGSLKDGLSIKNQQLYNLDHAPLCRTCDAYQCKRCIWLNRKTTYEVNTPSHEQCVISHLERNASRKLLHRLKGKVDFLSEANEIKEISYLDPFDVRKVW